MKYQHTLKAKDGILYPDMSYPMISQLPYHRYEPYSSWFINEDNFYNKQQHEKQKQESVNIIDINNQGKSLKSLKIVCLCVCLCVCVTNNLQ